MLDHAHISVIQWHAEQAARTEPAEAHRQMLVTLGRIASELGKAKPNQRELMGKVACLAGSALALGGDILVKLPVTIDHIVWSVRDDANGLMFASERLGDIAGAMRLMTSPHAYDAAARNLATGMVAWLERLGHE